MDKIWIVIITILVFLLVGFVSYRIMKSYVHEAYGKKWLTLWGNKVYFWQSLIFISMAGTVLFMYILKWGIVLAF